MTAREEGEITEELNTLVELETTAAGVGVTRRVCGPGVSTSVVPSVASVVVREQEVVIVTTVTCVLVEDFPVDEVRLETFDVVRLLEDDCDAEENLEDRRLVDTILLDVEDDAEVCRVELGKTELEETAFVLCEVDDAELGAANVVVNDGTKMEAGVGKILLEVTW